jgi:hypothetical protein
MRIVWANFANLNENGLAPVPAKPGVYLLLNKLAGDDWRCFYVGSTTDLLATLRQHRSPREPDAQLHRKIRNCVVGFRYSVQPDTEVRDGITQFLIQHYKPEMKVASSNPPPEPIDVNLP